MDVAEKQNPPRRGTESFNVFTVGFKLVAVVFCGDGKLNVTVRAGGGVAVIATAAVDATVDSTVVVAAVITLLIGDFSVLPSFC